MSNLDRKFSPDDFVDRSTIDSWWGCDKDSEGYTPLGAAILNGAPPECVAYIMQLYTFNNSDPEKSSNNKDNPYRDVSTDKSKGKSPLEVACMAMNVDAVNVVTVDHYDYQMKDESGEPVPKMTCYGDPLVDINSDGETIREYFMYNSIPEWKEKYGVESYKYIRTELYSSFPNSLKYKKCVVSNSDILAASILSKPDILKVFVTGQCDLSFQDSNGNTPILLACLANCYESVDHLLDNDADAPTSIMKPNNDDITALSVAIASEDQDLVDKLMAKLNGNEDYLLRLAFEHGWFDIVDLILISLITSNNIYNWLNRSYTDNEGNEITIIEYINDSNNAALYELLLPKYNLDKFAEFFEHSDYYNIVAFLYENNKPPFDDEDSKLITLLSYNDLYVDTIKLLFDRRVITLEDICVISDETKRNDCIDIIFTSPYNRGLMIDLINSSYENRDEVLEHLYSRSYFSIQNIADLHGTISDDILFDVIKSLDIPLSDIYSQIATDWPFKFDLIIYLFSQGSFGLSAIESVISSNSYKCSIIAELYSDSLIDIDDLLSDELSNHTRCISINKIYNDGDLERSDIYVIYDNYTDALSELASDLKPFIGSMKYSNEDVLSSYFFWMYNFSNHSGLNWYNPQFYQSMYPPIADVDLQNVGGSRYTTVRIIDSDKSVHTPSRFRLAKYNNKPEFYLGSSISSSNDINGAVVSFNQTLVPDKFSLPDDLYSINDNGVITWNRDHILYDLLLAKRCYIGEQVAVNHAPIILISRRDITASVGDIVTLNASASYDREDGTNISFKWTGDNANLLNSTTSNSPKFTVPSTLHGSTTFTLTVTDSENVSSVDTVTVSVINHPPVAVVSNSLFTGRAGDQIQLDASGSYDPDGDSITYNWTGAASSSFSSTTSANPIFTIPSTASTGSNYTLTVTVTDSAGAYSSAQVTINITQNRYPVIVIANPIIEGAPGSTVTIDVSGSYDPDGDELSFTWAGAYASQLIGSNPAIKQFKIPSSSSSGTNYSFALVVSDNHNSSSKEIIVKTVVDNIGKFAFETGVFTVEFVDDTDSRMQFTPNAGSSPTTYSMTNYKVTEQWSNVYSSGYTVEQVPKSPHWTSSNKVFYYDHLYDDNLDD